MRRPLRRLTIATTTIAAAALIAAPALAKVSSDSIGQKATVGTEAGSGSQPAPPPGPGPETADPAAGDPVNLGGGYDPGTAPSSEPANPWTTNNNPWISTGTGTDVRVGHSDAEGLGHALAIFGGIASGDASGALGAAVGDAIDTSRPGQAGGGGAATAAEEIDVQALAQTATSQMTIRAPEIASTPNDPDTLGAVGLPVWFWVANPGTETTGPNTTSATAGPVTVTATATFTGMTITTGDGTTIQCDGPGTEYPGTGIEESPDCGHIYEQMSDDQPDGVYTVDITAHWTVDWNATTGETGTIPIDLTTDKQLRIGSYQTVVTGVS